MSKTEIDLFVRVKLSGAASVRVSGNYAAAEFADNAGRAVQLSGDPDTLAEVLEEAATRVRRIASKQAVSA